MLLIALAVMSTLGTQPVTAKPLCPAASTTIDVDACLGRERDRAVKQLDTYRAAARTRLQRENAADTALLKGFDDAEAAWRAYRTAQCGAVATYWQGGTIRGAKALRCEIGMTELRTNEIWATWLTYIDSTPPLLPEPVVEPRL